MKCHLGPEQIILGDGLQPFMLRTLKGTLFVQAQLRFPPGYKLPEKNAYPGIPGNIISRDGGKSWSRWVFKRPGAAEYRQTDSANWNSVLLPAEYGPIYEGAATALRDGTVLFMEWIGQGPSPDGWYTNTLWESRDDFETLSDTTKARIYLPEGKGGFDDSGNPYSGLTFHRTLMELPSGDLLACVYCWYKEDVTPCPYQPKMNKARCVLLRSSDRGQTWHAASTIAVDPAVGEEGFDEPVMALVSRGAKAGRLVCLMRTGSNNCPVYQANSDDEGKTWTKAKPLAFHGVDPDLIEMADGTLAALIGRRISDEDKLNQRGYYLVLSRDAGETWQEAARWNTEPHALVKTTTYYSSLCELEPGRLLAVYDVGYWTHPVRYTAQREIRLG